MNEHPAMYELKVGDLLLITESGEFVKIVGFGADGQIWARPILGGPSACYSAKDLTRIKEDKPEVQNVQLKLF